MFETIGHLEQFHTESAIPIKAFFPREYAALYKQKLKELILHLEKLVRDGENYHLRYGSNHAEWNGVQLACVNKDIVWQTLVGLMECEQTVHKITDFVKQKLRESIGMVATNPQHFGMDIDEALEDIEAMSHASYVSSNEEMNASEDEEEEEEIEEFADVIPVKSKKEARELNDNVTERVKKAFQENQDAFDGFKAHAFAFGTGKETAEEFYKYLYSHMTFSELCDIIVDFARLLPQADLRLPLLKVHYMVMENGGTMDTIMEDHIQERWLNTPRSDMDEKFTPRHPSFSIKPLRKTRSHEKEVDDDSDDDHIAEFPETLYLAPINHLMFVIHGIGQHIDFQDAGGLSLEERAASEGGNHSFRTLLQSVLSTTLSNIPIALEVQSIEWHEELHETTGVDNVFDLICPEGASAIREFNKETFMDVLYYLSPRYGQLIVDSVTKQLNQKYQIFMEEHPGWDGKLSIFAHSLGSVIAYDILTSKPGEVNPNGIVFPGLEFEVEHYFSVGSPIPIMLLSRGQLQIENMDFTSGIRLPRCKHYFNVFHPIDPIAYRMEPLIKQEMKEVSPVQIIPAQSVKNLSFIKIQEMWERLTQPINGFPHRVDYVMKRRKREGVMEIAYATGSHSSYWISEDVSLFALMQICKPVVEKLHKYMTARQPLPRLMPMHMTELTPYSHVKITANALVRDITTGVSHERIIVIDESRIFVLEKASDLSCQRIWRLHFTPNTAAVHGDDAFSLKVKSHSSADDKESQMTHNRRVSAPASSAPSSTVNRGSLHSYLSQSTEPIPPLSQVASRMSISNSQIPGSLSVESKPGIGEKKSSGKSFTLIAENYTLKARSTAERDGWLSILSSTILRNGASHKGAPTIPTASAANCIHLVENSTDVDLDYFNAVKTGFLQEKGPKGWYEGWNSRWCVLQDRALTAYDNSPSLTAKAQVKIRKSTIHTYENELIFRIVSPRGTVLEFRVKDLRTFKIILETLSTIPDIKFVAHENLVENSPSAVLLVARAVSARSLAANGGGYQQISNSISTTTTKESGESGLTTGFISESYVRTHIDGYKLAEDENGQQFATFVIHVVGPDKTSATVLRRYSAFGELNRQLRKMIPHDQLPAFPSTRIWNKFDPKYLQEKANRLHIYLAQVCKCCETTRARPLILSFLEMGPQYPTEQNASIKELNK